MKTNCVRHLACNDISEYLNNNYKKEELKYKIFPHLLLGSKQIQRKNNILGLNKLNRRGGNNRKLNQSQVKEIRELLKSKIKATDIAKKYNVSYSVIIGIKQNKTYKAY